MRIYNKRNGLREAGSEYDKQITFMLRSKRKKEKRKYKGFVLKGNMCHYRDRRNTSMSQRRAGCLKSTTNAQSYMTPQELGL